MDQTPKEASSTVSPGPGPSDATYLEIIRRGTQIALVQLRDPDEAEEIAQEVAFAVWQSVQADPASFDASKPLEGFVFAAVSNKVVDRIRKETRREELDPDDPYEDRPGKPRWPDADGLTYARAFLEDMQRALRALPERRREVWLCVQDDRMSYEQTAQKFGIATETVHAHIRNANAMLRQLLAAYKEDR